MANFIYWTCILLWLNIQYQDCSSQQPRMAPVQVEVTACDGWQYASTSNSLQIQLKGQFDATKHIYINPFSPLPTNGRSQIFHTELNYYDIYGFLFSVLLSSDDIYGYCLKGISILIRNGNDFFSGNTSGITNQVYDHYDESALNTTSLDNTIHEFYHDYFGMGVILAKQCKYTYRSLSFHRSLVRCYDDYFEIYSRFTLMRRIRGIYKTVAHTCVHPDSGISSLGMVKNLYSVIMGKLSNNQQNVYYTTEFEYLDHVQVGYVDLDQLGHILAANVMLSHQYAFYTRDIEGKIIGIKLEAVGYINDQIYFQDNDMQHFGLRIDGKIREIHSISILGFGQYLVAFLSSQERKIVEECTEIIIYGSFAHSLYLNVFVIFEGFNDKYKLPFVVEEYIPYEYEHAREYQQDETGEINEQEDEPSIAYTTDKVPFWDAFADISDPPTQYMEEYAYDTTEDAVFTTEAPSQYMGNEEYEQEIDKGTINKVYNNGRTFDYGEYLANRKSNYKKRRRIQENNKLLNYESNLDSHSKKHGINWYDANKYCMDKYGTWLTSIHSPDENVLIHGFIGNDDAAWIGFVDVDINSMYNNDGQHNGCYMNGHNTDPYIYNCDWKWIDGSFVDYTNWKRGGPNNLKGEDCAFMDGNSHNGGWIDTMCKNMYKYITKYVCLSGKWYPHHKRKWEINHRRFIDRYALITIGNENPVESLCIDSVSLGNESQVFITSNWIGGGYIDSTLNSIFKAPVCKTEVLEITPQYETQIFHYLTPGSVLPDQLCQNEGRAGQELVLCQIDQEYALGQRTVFRLSSGNENTANLLWASPSKVTLTKRQTQSIETTDILEMDQLFRIRYTVPGPNNTRIFTNIRPLTLIQFLTWDVLDRNVDELEDVVPINFNLQQWERVTFGTLNCVGESFVPASHNMRYEMQFNTIIMQVHAVVELKLTLCSEFVNSMEYNQDSRFLYAHNIDAQILHQQPISCYIKWHAPEHTNNTITCAEDQKLAISTRLPDHLPNCRKDDSSLYDGCQCNSLFCWCVDKYGNILDGQAISLSRLDVTWREACVTQLKCNNSDVTLL